MKLLSLSQLFMPDTTGGTGRVARTLGEALVRHGEQVVVLTQRLSSGTPVDDSDLEICRYGSTRLRALLGMNAAAAIGIRRPLRELLRREDFDAAVGHQPASSLAAAAALRRRGIPELRMFHSSGALETDLRYTPPGPPHLDSAIMRKLRLALLWKIERGYLRGADHLCFLSRYTRDLAERLHGPHLPSSSIIPAGVDTNRFAPSADRDALRRRLLGASGAEVVLFTARNLAPRMGLDVLLRAMPALVRRTPALRLVIAGRGPLETTLKRVATDVGIAQTVEFLGKVSDEHLVEWYQACDLFVLPSVAMEGFGMVTAEAMACGAPVVATPVGASPELLDGLDPQLLSVGTSSEDLAEAIARMLALGDLQALRERIRAHALERYDVRLQASRVAALLRDLCKDRTRPGTPA